MRPPSRSASGSCRASASKIEAEVFLRNEAMEANRLLAESETRLRLLTDALPQIIWTATPGGHIEYCNERWTDWTGLPVEAGLGDGWDYGAAPGRPRAHDTGMGGLRRSRYRAS